MWHLIDLRKVWDRPEGVKVLSVLLRHVHSVYYYSCTGCKLNKIKLYGKVPKSGFKSFLTHILHYKYFCTLSETLNLKLYISLILCLCFIYPILHIVILELLLWSILYIQNLFTSVCPGRWIPSLLFCPFSPSWRFFFVELFFIWTRRLRFKVVLCFAVCNLWLWVI